MSIRLNNLPKLKGKITIIVIAYFITSNHAYAYLDPGTGSAILTAIIAAFAAVSVAIKNYWYAIKQFCMKKMPSKKKNKK